MSLIRWYSDNVGSRERGRECHAGKEPQTGLKPRPPPSKTKLLYTGCVDMTTRPSLLLERGHNLSDKFCSVFMI